MRKELEAADAIKAQIEVTKAATAAKKEAEMREAQARLDEQMRRELEAADAIKAQIEITKAATAAKKEAEIRQAQERLAQQMRAEQEAAEALKATVEQRRREKQEQDAMKASGQAQENGMCCDV